MFRVKDSNGKPTAQRGLAMDSLTPMMEFDLKDIA
jgi:hypothetical protein